MDRDEERSIAEHPLFRDGYDRGYRAGYIAALDEFVKRYARYGAAMFNPTPMIIKCEDGKLLAALTAQGQEVDLHAKIMNIKIDEDNMKFVIKEAIALGTHHNGNIEHVNAEKMVEWGYRLSHRDCRHAAAEIVAGHWRKVN